MNYADGDAKGVHALQWLCKKSGETYLKDGRYVNGKFFFFISIRLAIKLLLKLYC